MEKTKTTAEYDIPEKYAICSSTFNRKNPKGKPPTCLMKCDSYREAIREKALYIEKQEKVGAKKTKIGSFPYEYFDNNADMLEYSDLRYELISIVPIFDY